MPYFICRYRPECARCVQDHKIQSWLFRRVWLICVRGASWVEIASYWWGAGVIYSCTSFVGMSNMNSVQPIMAAERAVFYRWAECDLAYTTNFLCVVISAVPNMPAGSEHHQLMLLGRTVWQLELWKSPTSLSRRLANIEHWGSFVIALSIHAISSMSRCA